METERKRNITKSSRPRQIERRREGLQECWGADPAKTNYLEARVSKAGRGLERKKGQESGLGEQKGRD